MTKEYIGEAFRAPYCEALAVPGAVVEWEYSQNSNWLSHSRRSPSLPLFADTETYRFKPAPKRMVTLYDAQGKPQQLVAPEREAPKGGTEFFHNSYRDKPTRTAWVGNDFDIDALRNGNIFLTCEDAQAMEDFQRKQRLGEV